MNLFEDDLPMIPVEKRETSSRAAETGTDLLNRLLTTRRVRWDQKELERRKAENKKLRSDEWKRKYRPPAMLQEPLNGTIPASWVWVSAETACESVRDGTHDTPKYVSEGIPLVTSKDLTAGRIDFTKTKNISEADHLEISKRSEVENGDILFAMIGTVGNPLVVNSDRKFSIKNVGLFKKNDLFLESKYLKYWLESPSLIKWLTPRLKGSNQKFAPLELLRSLPVPLAPLSDQKHIVAEIEKQFTLLETAVAGLRRVQANLKRYRASVLKTACEGKLALTEAELARQEGHPYETGAQLLERILEERRKKWSGKGKYKEPVKPETTNLPELPKGWAWATLEQLGVTFGGLTKNPKRSKFVRQLPYLRVANVYANELRLDKIERIGVEDSELEKLLLRRNDLLIVEGNGSKDQIGRLAIWDGSIEPCVHQNHLIKVRPAFTEITKWILYWLLSPIGRHFVELVASSTSGLYTLSVNKVGDLSIAIPPIAEQQRIVAEVERRLSVVEELEAVVNANLQRASRLRHSILAKSFSGGIQPGGLDKIKRRFL